MKLLNLFLVLLLIAAPCFAQTAVIEFHGLRLGMTAANAAQKFQLKEAKAADTKLIARTAQTDDFSIVLLFSKNLLQEIKISYPATDAWANADELAKATSLTFKLPNDAWRQIWRFDKQIVELNKQRDNLLSKYTQEHSQVRQITNEIEKLKSSGNLPTIKTLEFQVQVELLPVENNLAIPVVTIKKN